MAHLEPTRRVRSHVVSRTFLGGVHIITAQDGAGHSAAANVTVLPQITISKLQGATGVQVTATGSGLQANATLSITFNNAVVTTTKTDALGAFKQDFTVPTVPNGSYDVKITDGTTTQDFNFSVQSTAPDAPIQLSPSSGTVVKLPLPVAWSYTGSSGITYELQVSTDPGFTEIVLDKTGITDQSYTIANNLNTVSGNLYYWRVRAVFRANKAEGNWSTANTFRISSARSNWMVIVIGLCILAALLLVVGSFFLIRLRKRSPRP